MEFLGRRTHCGAEGVMLNREGSYLAVVATACALVGAALVAAGPDRGRTGRLPGDDGAADGGTRAPATGSFINFETAHVHPIDITPDGSRLLACNTADNRLEVFDLSGGTPVLVSEIPVGLDPISVRARSNTEAWVVNNISDSVSVVSLPARNVVATLKTRNEPSDVVFTGTPQRAFVSCSQAAVVQVFDPGNLAGAPVEISVNGIDPRALAVSPDGSKVYCAIFNSGNASTLLAGGQAGGTIGFPPNAVSDPAGPYGGVNPPPNAGNAFSPPIAAANQSSVPPVGLIVKKNSAGQWMDDNAHNWTSMVSGANAAKSGRPVGWDMPDRDLAVIDASGLSVSYARGLMNICMALGVNPANGSVGVIGTDGINEVRFEPIVNGKFVRVRLAMVNPATLASTVKDLNPHLSYSAPTIAQSERDKSIGDPRAIAYNAAGTRAYITGMGSNNVVVVNAAGDRAGLAQTIEVGEGPTGVALDETRARLYVLNRFAASISVVSTASETVVATVPFFDPSPTAIKVGRKHLYDTHKTSGLGQAACASCHIDARMDRLAWDLGNPQGTIKQLSGQNLGAGIPGLRDGQTNPPFEPWHPMKGPMTTQTLQDIVGHEPFHWRGDRFGLEEFNGAFTGLLGDDVQLSPAEMQEFENFLATIAYPPNPYRNFDNTLPTDLPLTGMFNPGRFGNGGQPLPVGHPNTGLTLYRDTNRRLDGGAFACVTCHTLPTGTGPDATFSTQTFSFSPFPIGPSGERHHQLVSVDGSTNVTIKTPQLRNAYLKLGFEMYQQENNAGFGFVHDGSVDSLARFVSEPVFTTDSNQEVADLVAFLLCFSGSDLPPGSNTNPLTGPGTASKDVPASIGAQTTVANGTSVPPDQATLINSMISQAQAGKVGLVVKGVVSGEQRGFAYASSGSSFQSDRQSQVLTPAQLLALAAPAGVLTYTVVPLGSQTRIGIDRDENGTLDRDQADLACYSNCDGSHALPILNVADFTCFLNRFASGDAYANCDGSTQPPTLNVADFTCFLTKFAAGCP
jgi:YVTN family beta-propeller protein